MWKIGVAAVNTTISINGFNTFTPPFVNLWKNGDFKFNVYHDIHPLTEKNAATKPVRRDKNHEIVNEKSYASSISLKRNTLHYADDITWAE